LGLLKYKDAKKAFTQVLKLVPNDKDAKRNFRECDKAIKLAAFQRAIAGDVVKLASETTDLKNVVVEESYDGPRLSDSGEVTLEFVLAVIEHFRDQKRLHRKYVYTILLQIIILLRKLPTLVDVPVAKGSHITVPPFC